MQVILRGKYPGTLSEFMHRVLKMMEEWCDSAGIKVKPAKTTLPPVIYEQQLPKKLNI